MITKIQLRNFMSHTNTVIEPAAGLTVLVGPNNCGKSAVVAALQILCHNDNSTYVLRHGEKACHIKIETDDGHSVEWRRKNSPSYVIDGQSFDRLKSAGLPEELTRALRLPLVDAGNNQTFDIHFGEQKSPIFLLDKLGSCAASFFASSSDAIRLVEMQRLHRTRVADNQRDKDRLEKESKQLNDELDTLLPMTALDQTLRELEKEHTRLTQLGVQIGDAARIEQQLRRTSAALEGYEGESRALMALANPPRLPSTQPLAIHCSAIGRVEQTHVKFGGVQPALAPLKDAPEMADSASLAALCTRIRRAEADRAKQVRRQGSVADLQPPPELADSKSLAALRMKLAAATTLHVMAGASRVALEQLSASPALADLCTLRNLHRNLGRLLQTRHFHAETNDAVQDLAEPPPVPETHSLKRLIQQIGDTEDRVNLAASCNDQLTKLRDQPRVDLDVRLETLILALGVADQKVAYWEAATVRLNSVSNLTARSDTAPIELLVRSVRYAVEEFARFEMQRHQAEVNLDEAVGDLQAWAAQAQICPTCGGDIDLDKLLAQTQRCQVHVHA